MGKENLTLGNIDFENDKFYRHKTPIFQGDADIENVLIFNKIYFSEEKYKYCILVTYIMTIK